MAAEWLLHITSFYCAIPASQNAAQAHRAILPALPHTPAHRARHRPPCAL
nr:Hypothetical protein [Aeromonas sp.]